MLLTQNIVAEAEAADGFFSDETVQLSYGEFVQRVQRLKKAIAQQQGEQQVNCVALHLGNDLTSLSMLLALMQQAISFAVLPTNNTGTDGAEADDWPAFCDASPDWTALREGGGSKPLVLRDAALENKSKALGGCIYVQTSGTTGVPKWVVFKQSTLVENAGGVTRRLGFDAQDRVLIPVPICHMYGLGAALVPTILGGASVHLVSRGDPLSVLQAERDADPNHVFLAPSQCRAILALRRRPRLYRTVVIGGDRLPDEFAEKFETLHGPIVGLYGTSELGVIASAMPPGPSGGGQGNALMPLDGAAIVIEESDELGPKTQIGRIMVQHQAGFLGYADRSGQMLTQAPKSYPTNDLGYLLPDGSLTVIGRADNSIKRDGHWVHLGEIEECLGNVDGVVEAAVVPAGQTRRGTGIVAFCVMNTEERNTISELRRHYLDNLPIRAVPDHIKIVRAFDRLPSGKVDRLALVVAAEDLIDN